MINHFGKRERNEVGAAQPDPHDLNTDSMPLHRLDGLSELVAEHNAVSTRIAAILGRPAQLGHLGEFVASVLFDIQLESSANNKGFDGRFKGGALAGRSVDIKTYAKREGIMDLRMEDLPDQASVAASYWVAAGVSDSNRFAPFA